MYDSCLFRFRKSLTYLIIFAFRNWINLFCFRGKDGGRISKHVCIPKSRYNMVQLHTSSFWSLGGWPFPYTGPTYYVTIRVPHISIFGSGNLRMFQLCLMFLYMCSSIYELICSREAAQAYMNEAIEQGWTDGGWERGITIWNAAENGRNASLHVVRYSDFRVLALKSLENFQQWRQISIDNDGPWWKRDVVLALGSFNVVLLRPM